MNGSAVKILICGFMGAGKTTFLEKCQKNSLGFECTDLDSALARDFGIAPSALGKWIETHGLPVFREKEQAKVEELLNRKSSDVIALGGGSLNPTLLAMIADKNSQYKLVFLNTSFDLCCQRILGDANRPLAQMPKADLLELYKRRLPDYLKADLTLSRDQTKELEGLGILESLVHNLLNPNM